MELASEQTSVITLPRLQWDNAPVGRYFEDWEISGTLTEAVRAVGRLSSWVRTDTFRHNQSSCLRHVIYYLKTRAIRAMAALPDVVHHSRVYTLTKCRRCDGSGTWRSWDGERKGPCRRCAGKGWVVLHFIETAFSLPRRSELFRWMSYPEYLTWHMPVDEWWRVKLPIDRDYNKGFPVETSWQPNQPGTELSIEDAAGCLNTAETYFRERPGPRRWSDDFGSGEVDDFAYQLHVGRTEEGVCVVCGARTTPEAAAEANWVWCGATHRHVRSTSLACGQCHQVHQGEAIWKKIPEPAGLLAGPNVRRWVERRAAAVAAGVIKERE
jgi:hypothetical protein